MFKSVWDHGASRAKWTSQKNIQNVLKQVPSYFSCLGECCFAVKLQKCFMDYETFLTFHQHRGEETMTEFTFKVEADIVYNAYLTCK